MMFIIEDRLRNCKWRGQSWGWTVLIYFFVFHFGALTMHVRYNPDLEKKPTPMIQ